MTIEGREKRGRGAREWEHLGDRHNKTTCEGPRARFEGKIAKQSNKTVIEVSKWTFLQPQGVGEVCYNKLANVQRQCYLDREICERELFRVINKYIRVRHTRVRDTHIVTITFVSNCFEPHDSSITLRQCNTRGHLWPLSRLGPWPCWLYES